MSQPPDLAARSISAVYWGTSGAIVRVALQFATQVTLARILGPDQYGLFAIGVIVVSFSNFFSDIGIAYGLIQKKQVRGEDVRFVSTWQLMLGVLVTSVIAAGGEVIGGFFGEPKAAQIVKALAIVCLLNALAAPSLNLLKRELDYRSIQLAQILSYVVGYVVVGVPMALAGFQVWALVSAWLVQAFSNLLILYVRVRHPVRPLFWYAEAGSVSQYGLTVLATNITNWLVNNIDRIVVGRAFTSRDIGLYATSYNVLYNPTASLLGVVQPVFFSASSRVDGDLDRVARSYRALVGAITLFVAPAFIGVSVVAETFVLALYGPAWNSAAEILRPLAAAMPLFLVWGLTTPLLWVAGHISREFKSQLPVAALWFGVCWLAAGVSLIAVGWAVAALFAVRCLVILIPALGYLQLRTIDLWRAVRGGLLLSVACGIVLWFVDYALRQLSAHPALWLVGDVLGGLSFIVAALSTLPGLVAPEVAELLSRIAPGAPRLIAKWIRSFPPTEN